MMIQRRNPDWTEQEIETMLSMAKSGHNNNEISEALGRTPAAVNGQLGRVRKAARQRTQQRISSDAANPPIDTNDKERIRNLECELARLREEHSRLREQITWAQHADSESRTGGTLTIRASDIHFGDENHLLSCYASVEEKLLVVIRQYQPSRIQYIGFDDWIAGRGIFKEQDLQMAVSDVNQQIAVGAVKALRFMRRVREVTDAPITCHMLRGNHDYVNKTSMASTLFFQTRDACSEIANIDWKLHWDRAVVNLASAGMYNVLAMHGFGHSKISPNSPAFIDAVKDMLLSMQRKMQPEQQIRRVLSGHTHYLSVGLERLIGLHFDTTGGFQRNNRVQLGLNQRPVGAIVYVSPEGMDSDILRPLEIKPDDETLARELADPHLGAANRIDCGECLEAYGLLLKERGLISEDDVFGLTKEGRW